MLNGDPPASDLPRAAAGIATPDSGAGDGSERWRAVRAMVDAALELPAPARAAFLERAGGDAAVRADAARWLAACERAESAGDFLVRPAAERAAALFPTEPTSTSSNVEAATLGRLRNALGDAYEVERELGRGGMATVYLARDLRHRRRVAVKVVHAELAAGLG